MIICPKCSNEATKGVLDRVEGTGKKREVHLKMTPCDCEVTVKDSLKLEKTRALFDDCEKAYKKSTA